MRHLWLYRQSYIDTVFLSRPIWNDSFNYIWTSMLKYRIHLSKLICWNKMPTRCNRGSYCRSYCLLNMFQASLCPSSVAQEYYTVVATCVIWCCAFQVVGLVWSWGLYVRFARCCSSSILQTGHITLSSTPDQQLENYSMKYHRQQPLYNTLELPMMGIVMPETCWASSKICNKNLCCIWLAFYFHILTMMHGQNHIRFV